MTEPFLLDFVAARAALGGIGRTTMYGLVNSGSLTAVKIGRRTFITRSSVEAYVTEIAMKAGSDDAA